MSYGRRYTAGYEDDRDHLQELKGTLHHWAVMSRKFAEETRDPYAFTQYMNVERLLNAMQEAVERTLAIVMEEHSADLDERFHRLHHELCSKSTIFGSPC